MGNYEKMADSAAQLFLQQDQAALLARYPLQADDQYMRIVFLGDEYRVDRATGQVHVKRDQAGHDMEGAPCVPYAETGLSDVADAAVGDGWYKASPRQALIIMDMICNAVGAPTVAGSWITMQQASGASNSPSSSSLFERLIDTFSGDAARLQAACDAIGARAVPGGEVSCIVDAFEGVPVWLQFWDGDDEFPAQMKFLWDSSVRLYLHFETMWYILYELLEKLIAQS